MKKAVISMGMVLGIAAGMATMPIGVYAMNKSIRITLPT